MNQPSCITHGLITSFETRKVWTFTEAGPVEGLPVIILSCGCTHEAVRVMSEGLDDERQVVTLAHFTGEPIISYVAPYPD